MLRIPSTGNPHFIKISALIDADINCEYLSRNMTWERQKSTGLRVLVTAAIAVAGVPNKLLFSSARII